MDARKVELNVSEGGNELTITVDRALIYRIDIFGQIWYKPDALLVLQDSIMSCNGTHEMVTPVKYMGTELRIENWCLYCPEYSEGQVLWLKTGWVEPLHPVSVIKHKQPLEMAERKEG